MKLVQNTGSDRVIDLIRWKQDLIEDRNRLAFLVVLPEGQREEGMEET
jgi:hypothetical protein